MDDRSRVRQEWKPEQAAGTISLDELISSEEGGGPSERFVDRIVDEQDVERELLEGATRAAVRGAVEKLAPPDRRLIERRFYEEVPLGKLAEELGVSRQTVALRQRVALRQLRGALSVAFAGEAP